MKELREDFEGEAYLFESKNGNILKKLAVPYVVADELNGNNRIYSSAICAREAKRLSDEIRDSGIAGQLNHPKFSSTELDKISHVLTGVHYDPKVKVGVAEMSILNTSKGKDLLTLINSNVKLGASMRGFGTVSGQKVNDDYSLKTIDLVENPSYGEKTLITKANLIESKNEDFIEAFGDDEEIEQLEEEDDEDEDGEFEENEDEEFENYLESSDEEKLTQRLEEAEKKHADLLKRANELENKTGGKMKPKGLTLEDIRRNRPDILKQHKEEVLAKEQSIAYLNFMEAKQSGYRGSFEQYIPIYESSREKTDRDNKLLGERKLQQQQKREEQFKRLGGTESEIQAYREYVFSADRRGVLSFREWKKEMDNPSPEVAAQRTLRILREEAEKNVERLDQETIRKNQLRKYHEDIEKGIFEGTFVEWLTLKEEEDLEKLAQRTYREARQSGFHGSFNQYREILRNRRKK